MTKTVRITRIAVGTVLLFLGAQLSLPAYTPPFTLTTLSLFILSALLSPRDALISSLIYIIIGALGVPVFSNFTSGFGVLFGIGGGFFISFPFMAFFASLFLKKFAKTFIPRFSVFFAVSLASYVVETLWLIFTKMSGLGFGGILTGYILPFLPIDLVKCALAPFVISKIEGMIKKW